jgi:hypothetical protein
MMNLKKSKRIGITLVLAFIALLVAVPMAVAQYQTIYISVSLSASTIVADGDDSITVTATVTNGFGQPVGNYNLAFNPDYGYPTPPFATTNGFGIATCTYTTVFDGTRTIEAVSNSNGAVRDSETLTANAPATASTISVTVNPTPSGQFVNTSVTTDWTSTRTGKVIGMNKAYKIKVTYTSPTGVVTVATDSQKDSKSGTHVQSNVWGTTGTWNIDAVLYVADRAAGGGVAWKSVATYSGTHIVN